jgi:hypothetical protein
MDLNPAPVARGLQDDIEQLDGAFKKVLKIIGPDLASWIVSSGPDRFREFLGRDAQFLSPVELDGFEIIPIRAAETLSVAAVVENPRGGLAGKDTLRPPAYLLVFRARGGGEGDDGESNRGQVKTAIDLRDGAEALQLARAKTRNDSFLFCLG